MVILENIDIAIDIDIVILENIDIDKAILQNIDIDKISNWFKFGISNRASDTQGQGPSLGLEEENSSSVQGISFPDDIPRM